MTIIGITGRRGSGKDTTGRLIQDALEPGLDGDGLPTHPVSCYLFSFAHLLKAQTNLVFGWDAKEALGARKELADERYDRTRSIQLLMGQDLDLIRAYIQWLYKGEDVPPSVMGESDIEAFLDQRRVEGCYGPQFLTPRFAQQQVGTAGYRGAWDGAWVNAVFRQIEKVHPLDVCVVTDVRFPNEAEAVRDRGGVIWRVKRGLPLDPQVDGHASEAHYQNLPADVELDNHGSLDALKFQVGQALSKLIEERDSVTGVWTPFQDGADTV